MLQKTQCFRHHILFLQGRDIGEREIRIDVGPLDQLLHCLARCVEFIRAQREHRIHQQRVGIVGALIEQFFHDGQRSGLVLLAPEQVGDHLELIAARRVFVRQHILEMRDRGLGMALANLHCRSKLAGL